MKLLLKVLLFLLPIFQPSISEAKSFVFDVVVSEIIYFDNEVKAKNDSTEFFENDFGISCKSESNLLNYRKLAISSNAVAAKGIGNLKVPIYRVYGGCSSMYGKSYSLINPKFVPNYRNFAGLPNANTGQYLLRGNIPLKDIRVGRWFASPLDGRTGGLPLELYQNFNQLSNPANIILKKPF